MTTPVDTGSLEFVLPGSWWRIPLDDAAAQQKAISAIAEKAFGRADQHATLRRQYRRALSDAAARSAEAGAESWFLAQEIVAGVPLPANLTVTLTEPLVGLSASGVERNAELLARAVASFGERGWTEDPWDDTVHGSAVSRRARHFAPQAADDDELPGADTYRVNYWMTVPGQTRLALLSFGSTSPELRESLLQLFDAIIASVRFPAAETEEHADD